MGYKARGKYTVQYYKNAQNPFKIDFLLNHPFFNPIFFFNRGERGGRELDE